MPIRLCQKCGLKVLIDESQAGTNPFYCQRCTTAMKGQEGAAAPVVARNPTPSPVVSASRSDPAAASVQGAAKAATVRVLCPYCKASFNGRVPQKPARGSCPVCQKELILLPNGDIKPAAGFDLGQWSGDGAPAKSHEPAIPAMEPVRPEVKESGTRLLVKKYAAEAPAAAAPAARPAARAPEPLAPQAETDAAEEPAALPGWLDDSAQGSAPVRPVPETDMAIDVVEPPKNDVGVDAPEEVKLDDLPDAEPPPPPPPPAPRVRAHSPVVAKQPTLSPGRPPTAVEPPPEQPEPDLLPEQPAPKPRPLGRVPSGERKAPALAPAAVAADPGETGAGKVFLAIILVLLPVAACAGLLTSQDKLKHDLVKKIGARFMTGFAKLDQKLFPPPPPPRPLIEEKKPEPEQPKEEPPKPDANQQKKDEAAMSTLYTQIIREQRDLKSNLVAATPDQKERLQNTVGKDIDAKKEKLKQQQDLYRKMYGKDYDPSKE
jgi:hypothetical protein